MSSKEKQGSSQLWYTRRHGVETGPFPADLISRYLLIGRLHEGDEVSTNRIGWRPIREHPELIPAILLEPESPEREEQILQARFREDERLYERRHDGTGHEGVVSRTGHERRHSEPPEFAAHRERLATLLATTPESVENERRLPWVIIASVLLLGLMGGAWLLARQAPVPAAPDCSALGGPGVDWSYCRKPGLAAENADLRKARLSNAALAGADFRGATLAGANLGYADLRRADLSGADLGDAILTGAGLAEARLDGASLAGADLSYADLRGATIEGTDFSGARIGRAVWVDGRVCAPESVGSCR